MHRQGERKFIHWVAWAGFLAGLVFLGMGDPPPADSDRDGVQDSADRCPGTPRGREVDGKGCCSATKALVRGVEYLSKIDPSQAGDAFVVMHLRKLFPHPGLDRFIERGREIFVGDYSAWYITPGLPKYKLPDPLPRGVQRWLLIMNTPHAEPKEIADALLHEYLMMDGCAGYILTHQTLVYEIARSRGVSFAPEIKERAPQFLKAIYDEQRADEKFGDLYAERVMILLLYGDPKRESADKWIETIIDAQLSDGGWEDRAVYPFDYQGEHATGVTQRPHTSAISAYALALYLARFGG